MAELTSSQGATDLARLRKGTQSGTPRLHKREDLVLMTDRAAAAVTIDISYCGRTCHVGFLEDMHLQALPC